MGKVALWIGGIFTPIGLIFAAVGGWIYYQDQSLAVRGVHTQGTVVDTVSSRDSDGDWSYRPVVVFTDESGARHRFTSSVGSNPPSHSRGETVAVIYSPWAPEQAMIDSFFDRFLIPLVFGGFGIVFAVIGLGVLAAYVRHQRMEAQLRVSGVPLQARFADCYLDTSTRINGRSPWRVVCQATDPTTGKLHSFKSDPVWVNPTEQLKDREIKVLIDPARPKRYLVDLSPYIDEGEMA